MASFSVREAAIASFAVAVLGCSSSPSTGSGGAGGQLTGAGSTASHTASSSNAQSTTAASTSHASSVSAASTSASSTGAGPMCQNDGYESNDTIATAAQLPAITDCDSDAAMVSGILGEGGNDVDWFKYDGSDTTFCQVNPTRTLTGPGLRICKYLSCTAAQITCPSGTQFDTQAGKPGCCWTGESPVTVDLDCNGSDDGATVYIRVDHPNGPGCEAYSVAYHY